MSQSKKDIATNLKKAQSSLGKIIQMIEDDRYCIDIMQQNLAVIGLLKAANHKLMTGHLNSCVNSALKSKSGTKQKKVIDEIIQITKLSNK